MYSLDELFRGSTHKASAFTPEAVKWLEDSVFMKPSRSGEVPCVKCIIRKKDIRLTPEEAVRQLYVYDLIHVEGYAEENIKLEHSVHFGREVKRADIVIFERKHPDSEYIIIEVKKPNAKDGKEQLRSYCNATGALIGVWTNGQAESFYRRKDPNIFETIPRIPKASEKLRDVLTERWTIEELIKNDKLKDGKKTLRNLVQEIEDDVLAGAGVNAFEEIFKLIFTKLYDELQSVRRTSRHLEFRNYGDTDGDLKANINALFKEAMKKWKGVFDDKDVIMLSPSHLALCVSTLQDVKLFNSNLDVVDDAFEFLMTKSSKGEKGQFFTPRYVIDMCVRMLNPSEDESMIDTAAGSCGFPVHTMFYVWGKIYDRLGLPRVDMFTAEEKPEECKDYVRDKVFAIDFDPNAVRVARTLNLIAGDGHTNVMQLNTLDYDLWKETVEPLAWQKKYNEGWLRFMDFCETEGSYQNFMFDIVMANPPFAGDVKESRIITHYELAKDSKGKYVSKIGRDILFIERNLQFLKPGGRMAIILPQGRFNNSSDKYIRDFIAERCRILAVIGLHVNVFKPHTGTKTSVLLVQKWDEELCPRRDNYQIFFANMHKPSKDNSGEKIYRKDSEGHILLDEHYHPIVEHDLFNVKGLTEDGVVEAFIEFAKREGFSFFAEARLLKPFDEKRYTALMDGLEATEVNISYIREKTYDFRIDSEFYRKADVAMLSHLETLNTSRLQDGLAEVITDGTHFTPDYVEEGIPFLSALNVKKGYLDVEAGHQHITLAEHERLCKRVRPQEGDILLRKVGVGERLACVVPKLDYEFSIFVSVALIRAKINPYYLSTFINTKYGQRQLLRLNKGISQPDLHLEDIQKLIVPIFSDKFYDAISNVMLKSQASRDKANQLYNAAQEILSEAMHFDSMPSSQQNTAVVSFSTVFSTGRLDAEYFMPKYDNYLSVLNSFETTSIPAEYDIYKNSGTNYSETSHDVGVVKTKQLTNRGIDTEGVESWFDNDTCKDSTFLCRGDVVFASMGVGSLGKVSMFTYEGNKRFVTDSTLRIYRAKEGARVLPEVLCLFLQSEIGQEMIYRYVVGSTGIINIYDKDIAAIPIPILDSGTQNTIASLINNSFSLRRKSQHLINAAVKSVELAIESSEQSAINFITQEVS